MVEKNEFVFFFKIRLLVVSNNLQLRKKNTQTNLGPFLVLTENNE